MKLHYLNLQSKYFDAVINEEKKAELRFNDRDYQRGDEIIFQEITESGAYGAKSEIFIITHVLVGGTVQGLQHKYCILSIKPKNE